jgi:GNAT superfamily N-acetyltransferase
MNFYSDKIINEILDINSQQQLHRIDKFIEESFNTIKQYSSHNINQKYIYNVLTNTKNIITFFCLDNDKESFAINNCPSILVYHKLQSPLEIRYYILIACTKRKFRNQGYASKLLDGLIERIKKEIPPPNPPSPIIKIILSSLEESVLFYESYGFKWKNESIKDHPILMDYEKYDEEKEYFIMELILI